jgi:hypothetical protein
MISNIDELNDEELEIKNETSKEIKRSKIYVRDNGICDVCNKFVLLKDYDLGHLVDKSNGGGYEWDNLVVMHRECNHSKPHHSSVEEYNKWKLTKHLQIASNTKITRSIPQEQSTYIGIVTPRVVNSETVDSPVNSETIISPSEQNVNHQPTNSYCKTCNTITKHVKTGDRASKSHGIRQRWLCSNCGSTKY